MKKLRPIGFKFLSHRSFMLEPDIVYVSLALIFMLLNIVHIPLGSPGFVA